LFYIPIVKQRMIKNTTKMDGGELVYKMTFKNF